MHVYAPGDCCKLLAEVHGSLLFLLLQVLPQVAQSQHVECQTALPLLLLLPCRLSV